MDHTLSYPRLSVTSSGRRQASAPLQPSGLPGAAAPAQSTRNIDGSLDGHVPHPTSSLPPPAWLARLPPELVDYIPVCAAQLVSPTDLVNWCLVRRSWLKPSRAALYRTVLFASPWNAESATLQCPRSSSSKLAMQPSSVAALDARIQSFCDALNSNPLLGKLVIALDLPLTRSEQPCASVRQYKTILFRCPNILYLRNLQASVESFDSSPVDFPRGALSKLLWIDTDFNGYEEWQESVLQPMHFLRRIRFGSPRLVRGDNNGHGSFDLLNDTTTQVVTVDSLARQAFGDMGRSILRRLASTALPDHRFLVSTYMVHTGFSRHVARAFKARMRLYSVALPNLQMYEIHITDGSSQCGGRTYPRRFWQRLRQKILEITYPIHFAIAVYHKRGEELADTPNWEEHDFRERDEDVSDVGEGEDEHDYPYDEDELGYAGTNTERDSQQADRASWVSTRTDDALDHRASKRARRSAPLSAASSSSEDRRTRAGARKEKRVQKQHWESPMILPPFTREWQRITTGQEGGLYGLPFPPPKEPHPYLWFVDGAPGTAAVADASGVAGRRCAYDRGTMPWLRLVARNLESARQDLRL